MYKTGQDLVSQKSGDMVKATLQHRLCACITFIKISIKTLSKIINFLCITLN